jgi:hypothetical protein
MKRRACVREEEETVRKHIIIIYNYIISFCPYIEFHSNTQSFFLSQIGFLDF